MLQFPSTLDAGSVLITLLLPLSCQVLHWSVHSFSVVSDTCPLSTGVERTSATEGVFLMHHPWREMYSTPSYSFNTLPMAVYCWIWFANILLKNFVSKFIKTITFLLFFFKLSLFVSVWKQCWPHIDWTFSLLFYFSVEFEDLQEFFLNVLHNSPGKPVVLDFWLLEAFWFFNLFKFYISLWFGIGRLYVLRLLFISHIYMWYYISHIIVDNSLIIFCFM